MKTKNILLTSSEIAAVTGGCQCCIKADNGTSSCASWNPLTSADCQNIVKAYNWEFHSSDCPSSVASDSTQLIITGAVGAAIGAAVAGTIAVVGGICFCLCKLGKE